MSFKTLYFEQWVGCCPSTTNELMLADTSTGNRQKLEAYANKNECEILDMASENLYGYDEKDRDLPVADNYIRISCKINDEL